MTIGELLRESYLNMIVEDEPDDIDDGGTSEGDNVYRYRRDPDAYYVENWEWEM